MKFKNSTEKAKVLGQAVKMKEAGKSNAEIMAALDLSHSQLEVHLLDLRVQAGEFGGYIAQPKSLTEKAAIIAKLRTEGQSWGLIAIRLKESEAKTARDFREATGMTRKGMRIGKGGAYVGGDPRFYVGADRAKLGTELVASVPLADQVPAEPDVEPKRVLPTIAKTGKVRKPRAPRKPKA